MDKLDEYIEENKERIEEDLQTLVAQKSVSPTGEGVEECAELVTDMCIEYGFDESKIVETQGHPAVIASKTVERDKETLILYGHYDVQPVNESKWDKNPFNPAIEEEEDGEGRIYARGAGDNKAQFFAHLCALEALEKTGNLNTNVILLLEGEEETGSPNLSEAIEKADTLRRGDFLICADGPKEKNDLPVVELGCRGLLYMRLKVKTGERNLHSGEYGGLRRNASMEISKLISSIKDKSYEVKVDNFYQEVREPEEQELEWIRDIEERIGSPTDLDLGRGKGMEKIFLYPNLNITGIESGAESNELKTIIPCEATSNIGIRMVANQTGEEVFSKIKKHFQGKAPTDIDLEINKVAEVNPYITDRDSNYIEKVIDAVDRSNSTKPLVKPVSSATLPFDTLNNKLDIECVKIPYANTDENNHSPDENMKMKCFYTGIKTTASILQENPKKKKG